MCHGGTWHWLDKDDGIDLWGAPCGHTALAGSGWWDWFLGARHGGTWHWLDRGNGIYLWGHAMRARNTGSGRWDWFMGARDLGWIEAMGLNHGGAQHWLNRGDGIDLWGCTTLDGSGQWDWFMGARHGGAQHWLDQGNEIGSYGWGWGVGGMGGKDKVLYGCWNWMMIPCVLMSSVQVGAQSAYPKNLFLIGELFILQLFILESIHWRNLLGLIYLIMHSFIYFNFFYMCGTLFQYMHVYKKTSKWLISYLFNFPAYISRVKT